MFRKRYIIEFINNYLKTLSRNHVELKTGKEKEQLEREAEEKFAKAKELQERTP